ncbi:MAG TPA: flagellar motor stator protein MotA [Chthonomonadaceae bacterium]|nr:flagellar motor stator protein MotA [Chthonomonadaceae bacterium]
MFVLIGLAIIVISILGGFMMEGGKPAALAQITEFIIIGGSGLGSLLIANPLSSVMAMVKSVIGLLKGNPYTKARYSELLKMLYDIFMMARREGLVALDQHVEKPGESKFFQGYPGFIANHHAMAFLSDTMKIIISGAVTNYDLAEMMEIDLEASHDELHHASHMCSTLGDSMPGFGIVAAVLGVVITMGAIGGEASEIGHKVGAALVGTFLGILLAYGVFSPLAKALEMRAKAEEQYLGSIKNALLSFSRGDAPLTAVEFARRNIDPDVRPSFSEMESTCKNIGEMAKAA